MLKYDNDSEVLYISESERQDTIAVHCSREQLITASDMLSTNGINEDDFWKVRYEPSNNWKSVAMYNEESGYTTLINNTDNVLQIAKVKVMEGVDIIILKHLGHRTNRQCNFSLTEKQFIECFRNLLEL